jgi:ribosomal protein S18 acetylase RimI-like enzyme
MVNVKDEYQGQGIGSKFFSELEERVNEKGIGAIRLLVEKKLILEQKNYT